MRVYISGPITGILNRNKKAFAQAHREIAALKTYPALRDIKIINPQHIAKRVEKAFASSGKEPQWSDYMRVCIKELCGCDYVYFLNGWKKSMGASMEMYVSVFLKLHCVHSIKELSKALEVKNEY